VWCGVHRRIARWPFQRACLTFHGTIASITPHVQTCTYILLSDSDGTERSSVAASKQVDFKPAQTLKSTDVQRRNSVIIYEHSTLRQYKNSKKLLNMFKLVYLWKHGTPDEIVRLLAYYALSKNSV